MYSVCLYCIRVTINLQEEAKANDDDDASKNYKSGQQFAEHMKESSKAVSSFAKSKTVKQQREYLPIYAVRQDVSIWMLDVTAATWSDLVFAIVLL